MFQKLQSPTTAAVPALATTTRHGEIDTAVEKGQLSLEKGKLSLVNRPAVRTPHFRQLQHKQLQSKRSVSFNGALGGSRVLVVDDLFVNRKLLRIHLEKMGCEIDTASDGIQAVSMSLKGNYDLIFMDIHMPYLNGIEAARQIKARMSVCPMIVGITADHGATIRAKCLTEGMVDVLVKPVRMQQLMATLGEMRTQLDLRKKEQNSESTEVVESRSTG